MPPPGSYATFLLIIGPAGAAGGVEGEQKIAIIFILLFARLQLRCIHREAVENFCYFVLYLTRWNRNPYFCEKLLRYIKTSYTIRCFGYLFSNFHTPKQMLYKIQVEC